MDFLRFEFRPLLSKPSTKRQSKQLHIVPMLCKRQKATKKWINVQSFPCLYHVGDQEQKHFSPLGTKLYFHVNSSR